MYYRLGGWIRKHPCKIHIRQQEFFKHEDFSNQWYITRIYASLITSSNGVHLIHFDVAIMALLDRPHCACSSCERRRTLCQLVGSLTDSSKLTRDLLNRHWCWFCSIYRYTPVTPKNLLLNIEMAAVLLPNKLTPCKFWNCNFTLLNLIPESAEMLTGCKFGQMVMEKTVHNSDQWWWWTVTTAPYRETTTKVATGHSIVGPR